MIWATCTDCGKRSYLSKHAARQARKTLPDRRGLSVYECGNSGFWHVGHLPFAVRRGDVTRGEIYGSNHGNDERESA